HDLVAVDDPAASVDDADAVAVAVERDADLVAALDDRADQVLEVLRHGRVGVVVRESSVDLGEQTGVAAGHPARELGHGRAGGTVAGVPHDAQGTRAVIIVPQALDIGVEDPDPAGGALAHLDVARRPDRAEPLVFRAVDRARAW